MKQPVKTKVIVLLAGLFIACISCNKGDNSGKTITKCVTCLNGGQCINDTCRCPAGYTGVGCETRFIDKFLGEWLVTEQGNASTGTQTYEIEINNIDSVTTLNINGLSDNFAISVLANVVGDSIYIATQTVDGNTYVGVGYIHAGGTLGPNGEITMRYQVTNTSTGVVNDFGYSSPNDNSSQWIKE